MLTSHNYIFVVGCQRSGTTLLGQVLGAHPNAVLIDENNDVYTLIKSLISAPENEEEVLRQCLTSARESYMDDGRFSERGTLRESVSHIVLKAPNATYEYERLRELYDGRQHFVFAVRDVRDVVCSMELINVPFADNQLKHLGRFHHLLARFAEDLDIVANSDTPEHLRSALIWKIKSGLYAKFTSEPLDSLLVRYENLVTAPNHWRARIFDHVGLATGMAPTIHHQKVMQGVGPGGTKRARAVDQTSMHRWKSQLSDAQEQDIWNVAGDLMQNLGYQR